MSVWKYKRKRLLSVRLMVPTFTVILVVNILFKRYLDGSAIKAIRLVVKNIHGDIILHKDVTEHWNQPLRFWNCSRELLVMLHIPKSGGTSFRESLRRSLKKESANRCNLEEPRERKAVITKEKKAQCYRNDQSTCASHFDWGTIKELEDMRIDPAPLVLLRNPVDRFVSNFYFVKKNMMWEGSRMISQNLSEYLNDHESMMESRCIWHDGQAAVSWLAGTHVYRVGHPSLSSIGIEGREALSLDWTYMLNTAIDNLHKSLWFGILEEMDASMEMLGYQTGLDLHTEHFNTNTRKPPRREISDEEIEKIKVLMPLDLYLYQYAKQLHKNRWNTYQKQRNGQVHTAKETSVPPKMPTVIDGCTSTRHGLKCPVFNYKYNGTVKNIAPGVDLVCNLLCNVHYLFQFDLHFQTL